jgi:hypothetical protein
VALQAVEPPPPQPGTRLALPAPLRASLSSVRDAASHPIGQAAIVFAATAALRRTVLRDVSNDDLTMMTQLAVGVTFASVLWSGLRDASDAVRTVGEGVRTVGEGVHAVARSLDGVGAGARDAGAWCVSLTAAARCLCACTDYDLPADY